MHAWLTLFLEKILAFCLPSLLQHWSRVFSVSRVHGVSAGLSWTLLNEYGMSDMENPALIL